METKGDLFRGKVCVVTGAGSGIGLGLSRQLLLRGATVWMSGRAQEKILAAGESLAEHGERVHAEAVNVTDYGAVKAYVDRIAAQGPIDYLFNNAGVGFGGLLVQQDMSVWKRVVDTNLYGVAHGVMAALPHLIRQGYGHIVNTASVAGLVPLPFQSIYVATKYAVVGLSESLRYELEPFNVKVTVVCPAAVATDIFGGEENIPAEAISIDQAGIEIIEGLEKGMNILPIVDFARDCYRDISADPAANDARMRWMAEDARKTLGLSVEDVRRELGVGAGS